jgi:hypothetical protein
MLRSLLLFALLLTPLLALAKTALIHAETPAPKRFVVEGKRLLDKRPQDTGQARAVFFRGLGYSPYRKGETPQKGGPGNDERYPKDLRLITDLGVNYLHVFPLLMPENFFKALDETALVYGQDIWIDPFAEDILAESWQNQSLERIKRVIDHTYAVGRPDRLLLFSIGDELQAATVRSTNQRHPQVKDYQGKHLSVADRTASEVALAQLIDAAMDYELSQYGERHLYCHTSWTHIGPIADRPDLELEEADLLLPDMGDLLCMNIYTYANGVKSSPPGSVTGSPFQGYLEQLAASSRQPILLTQVGFSTSPIMPRPEVEDYGGHGIDRVPERYRAIWKDLRSAKGTEDYCGLVWFEFHDEWWKIGWMEGDENQLEVADPEEWFGIYALEEGVTPVPKGNIPAEVRRLFAPDQAK